MNNVPGIGKRGKKVPGRAEKFTTMAVIPEVQEPDRGEIEKMMRFLKVKLHLLILKIKLNLQNLNLRIRL